MALVFEAQGMLWRTEPEIDGKRQRYLAERGVIQPDFEEEAALHARPLPQ
jgi:hypothetical protein